VRVLKGLRRVDMNAVGATVGTSQIVNLFRKPTFGFKGIGVGFIVFESLERECPFHVIIFRIMQISFAFIDHVLSIDSVGMLFITCVVKDKADSNNGLWEDILEEDSPIDCREEYSNSSPIRRVEGVVDGKENVGERVTFIVHALPILDTQHGRKEPCEVSTVKSIT